MESEKINEIKNEILEEFKILKVKNIKEYKADYYIKNKKKIVCEICEGLYEPSTKARHNKSIKHYNALNPDTQKPKRTNKEKI